MATLANSFASSSIVHAQSSRDVCARRDQSPAATSLVVSFRLSCNPMPTAGVSSNYLNAGWPQIRNSRPFPFTYAIGPSGVGPVPTSTTFEGPSDEATTAAEEDDAELEDLKEILVDNFFGTERGLRASSETRGEIVELITQLEAKNPTPAPTEALALLDGKWILAYTSNSELYPLLLADNLPLVKVGEISQTVDTIAFTVQNKVSFTSPVASTSFSNSGVFEVRSPKRVQVKFQEGVIGTPQLTDYIEIPESVDVLGQKVNLTVFQSLLSPLQNVASSVARTISGQPPVKFPIQTERAQSWLLTTYLDKDLRISRGDGGGLFVLVKEGSPLLL